MKQATRPVRDIERDAIDEAHLTNITVRSLSWRGIHVEKRSRLTEARPALILSEIDGYVEAGTLLQRPEKMFTLNWTRDAHRPHGTFR